MCLEKMQVLKHYCGKHIILAWKLLLSTIKTAQHSASVNLEFLIFFLSVQREEILNCCLLCLWPQSSQN